MAAIRIMRRIRKSIAGKHSAVLACALMNKNRWPIYARIYVQMLERVHDRHDICISVSRDPDGFFKCFFVVGASEAVNVALQETLAAFFIYVPRGLFGISSGYNKPFRRSVFFTFSFHGARWITLFGTIRYAFLVHFINQPRYTYTRTPA